MNHFDANPSAVTFHSKSRFGFTCNDENNETVSCLPAKYQHPGTLGWQRPKRQRLLKKSFCGGSSSRFSQLAPGGGTYQRLSEARWSADLPSWRRAALSMDPSGARISKFLLRVWRCRLFTALWSLFLRVVAAPWKEVGGKLAAGSITLRCKAAKQWLVVNNTNLGWLVVNTTPTLCSKRTSARARKVRKKCGNFHGKIKSDS